MRRFLPCDSCVIIDVINCVHQRENNTDREEINMKLMKIIDAIYASARTGAAVRVR